MPQAAPAMPQAALDTPRVAPATVPAVRIRSRAVTAQAALATAPAATDQAARRPPIRRESFLSPRDQAALLLQARLAPVMHRAAPATALVATALVATALAARVTAPPAPVMYRAAPVTALPPRPELHRLRTRAVVAQRPCPLRARRSRVEGGAAGSGDPAAAAPLQTAQ